ncbi:MAG: DUF177 domain-containing protein [Peptoniphilus sp.]|uniref:YceD family protein n=1 Tax=Peptoniphilus sp. TaxID=1971214 RepID=UPI0025E92DB9|nr:DUF177 domain-containing protein [Peptoniphilus sp.]MCI5643333.1 DUF177 domain-containing protein [Peptoniphilus sp.]MDD7351861.1 DUF177 domain-containing protein [Peptoniphilaceae bacterium]
MKLDLSAFLSSDDVRLNFDGSLEENDTDLSLEDLNLIYPIEYNGYIHDLTGELELCLNISYKFKATCDRCLKEFIKEKETSYIAYNFKDTSLYDDDSVDEYFKITDDSVDLSEIIFSQIITSIVGKNLCREDCKGLCPHCGKNLNEGTCYCEKESSEEKIDPRFGKLLDLFKDEEV